MKSKFFLVLLGILFLVMLTIPAHAIEITWSSSTDYTNGLPDVGSDGVPATYFKDGYLYLHICSYDLGIFAYTWNGTGWDNQTGSTLTAGLTCNGGGLASFEDWGGNWSIITGDYDDASYHGFTWNGTGWDINNALISGITGGNIDEHPTILKIDNTYYMISGDYYPQSIGGGGFHGFKWNGSTWEINSSITNGLSLEKYGNTPSTFWYGGYLNLITGSYYDSAGSFYGFTFDENTFTWSSNPEIVISLPKLGDGVVPYVGSYNSYNIYTYFLLAGRLAGDILAYTIDTSSVWGYVTEPNGNPVPNALVRIYDQNNTWSDSITTDADGYYVFLGIDDLTTYMLQATKAGEFKDSAIYGFTTGERTSTRKDITLERCTSALECGKNVQYVEFTIKCPFGEAYGDVLATVYDAAGEQIYNGTTSNDGKIVFLLVSDEKYTITFIKISQSIDESITLFPKDDSYTIYVCGTDELIKDITEDINYSLYAIDNNVTTTWLNLSYTSNTSTTSGYFWVKNESGTLLYNTTSSSFTNWSPGYAVDDSNNMLYTWGFNITHATWGALKSSEVIRFRSQYLIDLKIDDTRIYTWLSIGFLTLIAALFSYRTNRYGYILLPLMALFTWSIGWFPSGYQLTHLTLIVTTLVIGVLAYIRLSEKKGAYPY